MRKATAQDFISLTAAIQMDLRAAQAKMVELRAWIASLELPDESEPYTIERGEAYVNQVGYLYTDLSLEADLRERGASYEHIPFLLGLAAKRREQVQTEAPAA
jgi:hypothetical protein